MLLRVAVQDGNRKEWSELTRRSLAIASRLAVSHELAVRCHLRLESSKGSARLHIQDGSWKLSWGCPPESLWRVFTCTSGFSQHAADFSQNRHSKVPRQSCKASYYATLETHNGPFATFCQLVKSLRPT